MANDPLTEMSGLTKAHVGLVMVAAILTVAGVILQWRPVGSVALAVLIGTALMTALDDPEADEPLALPLRIVIGYAVGTIFGLLLYSAGGVWN